ncbi:hypothetical protein B5X24_HaOG216024 [Helicoverpa armigera]|nr:hypothetical protein B5X24_HaOG216024 [Helicoverpa armigera]
MEMSGNEIVLPSDPRSDRRHDLSGKHGVKSATGQAGAGNQAPPGINDTGRPRIKLRNKFRVGTWNVRGLQAADTWRLVNRRRDAKANGASIKELNDLGSEIQTACRRDRNSELKNICTELERHSQKFETKDLHMKIKVITRQFKAKTWAVENSAGESVTDIKLIVKVWEDYCKSLFTDSPNATDATISYPSQREPCILREEVAAAIKHLKRGKAVGVDEIPIEIIKDMGDIGVDIMHIICTKIWDTGEWPRDWSKSVFIPLHKKGSTKKCNNYRLISLISHGSTKALSSMFYGTYFENWVKYCK